MTWDSGLNAEQRSAAGADAPVVVVQAGAGSGKTRTLVARARRAVNDGARGVLALSFTRSAAREMQRRIGVDETRIHATTIHGLAVQLVARWPDLLPAGVGSSFQIAGDEALALADGDRIRLRRSGLLTYDEILTLAVCGVEEGLDFPRPDLVLVDEAQDLTPLQWRLIRGLGGWRFVVGDFAQSIFGWNGADPAELRCESAGAVVRTLRTNYRSVPSIVTLANLIPTPGRLDLMAHRPMHFGAPRALLDADVAAVVRAVAERAPVGLDGVAVLTRTNDRLREVADALDAAGVAYTAPALAGDIWGTDEGQVVLSAVHVAANPGDSLHLAHLMRVAGAKPARLARLDAKRARRACSLHAIAVIVGDLDELPRVAGDEVDAAAGSVMTALFGWSTEPYREALDRLAVWNGTALAGADRPADWLRWFSDPNRVEPTADPGEPSVYLTTIHGAKGMEWPHVVVYGMEAGSLPHDRAARDGSLEEERRLFYVAVTRAADSLTLMHYSERRPWRCASPEAASPSRFLAEVGLAS